MSYHNQMQKILTEGTSKGNRVQEILEGTYIVDLTMNSDQRGTLSEIFRKSWFTRETLQWNYTLNNANVMRGAHVHLKRNEHIIIAHGEVVFGIKDLRKGSPTEGVSRTLTLSPKKMQMLYVPTGVVHGLYSVTESIMLVGQTAYYERGDELDCFYKDHALGFTWPDGKPTMSDRDRDAGPLRELLKIVPPWKPASSGVAPAPAQAPAVVR